MVSKLDDFKESYIVVPKFVSGGWGITTIDRGDMTNEEWRQWTRVRECAEIKQCMRKYSNTHDKPEGLTAEIVKLLTNKEVPVCATCQTRPL